MTKTETLFVAIIIAIVGMMSLVIKHSPILGVVSPAPTVTTVQGRLGPDSIYPSKEVPGATNPDITQDNISQNICNKNWSTKSIRPPSSYTSALKKQQLKAGMTFEGDLTPANYEEDHLISLELGGDPKSPKNLWPEPYNTTIDGQGTIGARQKDKVENYLHAQVCSGAMSLGEAQLEISSDWYAVYESQNTDGFGGVDTNDN